MRMDNETFRLKVENLFGTVRSNENGDFDADLMAELEQLAATPRKTRYFLKALAAQDDENLQEHFYRLVMSRIRTEQETNDLERHIRHMFYEDREHAKAMLARLAVREVLPALFRVIALTEEGWLAGELIRLVLAAPVDQLQEPLALALDSKEYLLQCLAIYLIGKTGEDRLLHILARFYRKPVGEKVDRLERKALDAILEGAKEATDDLVIKWLKDKSGRVRDIGLTLSQERKLIGAVGDVAGLVLIDPKTRSKAAATLLLLEDEGALNLRPGDASVMPIARLMQNAKQEPLQGTLRDLMRDESSSVREVAIKLVPFLAEPRSITTQVRRLAVEDRATGVQIAALQVLAEVDPEKFVPVLIEVFTDVNVASVGGRDVIDAASALMNEKLKPEQVKEIEVGIKAKEERRDAALDRFAGNVEWWRHDI